MAYITPIDAYDQTVMWESYDENIATVDPDGTVKGVGKGETYIRVTTVDGGYSAESHVFVADNSPTPTPTPASASEVKNMYRMYNPNSGEHFYTGNIEERDSLVATGWVYEGIGFRAPITSNKPMYRLYNENAGDHHYTSNTQERDHLKSIGWKYEGIGWYATDNSGIPMYRLYNPNATGAGSHHYTSNVKERDNLKNIGWKAEGIGFYACK